jgi:hypothetical protein
MFIKCFSFSPAVSVVTDSLQMIIDTVNSLKLYICINLYHKLCKTLFFSTDLNLLLLYCWRQAQIIKLRVGIFCAGNFIHARNFR